MKTQQTEISEVQIIYRTKVKASYRPQIKCSKDEYDLFMETWDLDRHNFGKSIIQLKNKKITAKWLVL